MLRVESDSPFSSTDQREICRDMRLLKTSPHDIGRFRGRTRKGRKLLRAAPELDVRPAARAREFAGGAGAKSRARQYI